MHRMCLQKGTLVQQILISCDLIRWQEAAKLLLEVQGQQRRLDQVLINYQ